MPSRRVSFALMLRRLSRFTAIPRRQARRRCRTRSTLIERSENLVKTRVLWASGLAEDAAEDRIDVLGVVALVEEALERVRQQIFGDILVDLEEIEEAPLALPGRHGVALDGEIGVLRSEE